MTKYTVSDNSQSESGLTQTEVVDYIYRDDGQDYRLVPRYLYDDDDEETDGQDSLSGFPEIKIWDAQFFQGGKFYSSAIQAFGKNEDEAMEDFLQSAWDETRWDDSKWIVMSDDDYQKMIVQAEEEA